MKDHKWNPSKASALQQERELEKNLRDQNIQQLSTNNEAPREMAIASSLSSSISVSESVMWFFCCSLGFVAGFVYVLFQKRKQADYISI